MSLRNALVFDGLERAQRQVLEFPFELPQAQPIGERRVDVHYFARRFPAHALVAVHQETQRLRPFGELDQHDANVVDHGEQHLAQVFGLRAALLAVGAGIGVGRRMDDVHPRDAADQRRDIDAERRDHARVVVTGNVGEADEQRRGQRIGIEPLRGEDAGRAERTIDEPFALGVAKVAECVAGRFVRGCEAAAISRRIDRRERIEPRVDRLRHGSLRRGVRDGNHAEL